MSAVEQRLKALEDENKKRKGNYPIAGSLVEFITDTSPVYYTRSPEGSLADINVRIKFQADNPVDGKSLVELRPEVYTDSSMRYTWANVFFVNQPQVGDGSIILNLKIKPQWGEGNFYFYIVATGTSGGTFTLL